MSDGLQPPHSLPHMAHGTTTSILLLGNKLFEKLVCVAGKGTQWEVEGRLARMYPKSFLEVGAKSPEGSGGEGRQLRQESPHKGG